MHLNKWLISGAVRNRSVIRSGAAATERTTRPFFLFSALSGNMFRSITARLPALRQQAVVSTQFANISVPRPIPVDYDAEIVAKYPAVLDVIMRKKRVTDLSYTDRVAYFIATHKRGGGKGRSMRKDTNKRLFNELVDKRVRNIRALDRKAKLQSLRMDQVRGAEDKDYAREVAEILPRLSTYKEVVNKEPKRLELTLTTRY